MLHSFIVKRPPLRSYFVLLVLASLLVGCVNPTKQALQNRIAQRSGLMSSTSSAATATHSTPSLDSQSLLSTIAPHDNSVQIGRYRVINAVPTNDQQDILQVMIQVTLPTEVQTLQSAVEYLLLRSGYQLTHFASSSEVQQLLTKSIPAVHRHLGPMTLQRALETLAGSPFRLHVDPVHRQLRYELVPAVIKESVHEHTYRIRCNTPMSEEDTDRPSTPRQLFSSDNFSLRSVLPRWLSISVIALLVVTMCGLMLLSVVFKTSTPNTNNRDALSALLDSASPITNAVNNDKTDQQVMPSLPLLPEVKTNVFTSVGKAMPTERPVESAKITQLETQLAQVSALVATQQRLYESEKQSVAKQFKLLNEQLQAFKKQSAMQPVAVNAASKSTQTKPKESPKASQKAVTKRVTAPTKAPVDKQPVVLATQRKDKDSKVRSTLQTQSTSLTPPFTLVSIDQWGNDMHAVVRYQGQLHTLTPGSSLSNWRVDGVNETGEGVYVLSSHGHRSLLTLE